MWLLNSWNILLLSMLMKAFEKWRRVWQLSTGGAWKKRLETEWMMASQPPLISTPSWFGRKRDWAENARQLDERHWRDCPIAIGHRPPLFFHMGIRVSSQKYMRMKGGARLEAKRSTRLVREKNILLARFKERHTGTEARGAHRDGSQRGTPGRKPEGPGAE